MGLLLWLRIISICLKTCLVGGMFGDLAGISVVVLNGCFGNGIDILTSSTF